MTDFEKYKEFLNDISIFYNYSNLNIFLIKNQYPEATKVATYKKWQELNRQVIKGQKGIKIVTPFIKKIQEKTKEEEKGNKEIAGFGYATVFDINQTEGESIDNLVKNVNILNNFENIITEIEKKYNLQIKFEILTNNMYGYTDFEKIVIDGKLLKDEQIKTIIHELAHILLKHKERKEATKEIKEIEAESVSYIVSKNFDFIKTEKEKIAHLIYIQNYYKKLINKNDNNILNEILNNINQVSKKIINTINEVIKI